MRIFLPLCLFFCAFFFSAQGQAPQGINYQGVARDTEGKPLVSRSISVRISILKESANGEAEYIETHEVMTNSFGLFTLVIGQGSASTGSFQFVSWAIGNKWLQIELDPEGGNSFQLLGSQQLMSVPYAFYATYSGNGLAAGQGIKIQNNQIINTGDSDNSPSNELITDVTFGSDKKLKITEAGVTHEADLSALVGASQNLSGVLTIGNDAGSKTITNLPLPSAATDAATKAYVDAHTDADANATNEIQDLNLTGNALRITGNATATPVDLTPYLDNTDNQNLSLSGNNLSIANGNSVSLSSFLDNTDAQTLAVQPVNGDTRSLSITGGNAVNINVADNDNNSSNEIQNMNQVLTTGNDAGGVKISNLGAPTANADAATKQYVDNLDATDLDKNNLNEIQNLNQVLTTGNNAGGLKIANLGAPTANADAATKQYVDNLDATDLDKNSSNEIQTLTYSSATNNLAISGGNNVTISTNLSQVLAAGADAGAQRIQNIGTPTANGDATNKGYVDNAIATAIATNYAFKVTYAFTNPGGTFTDSPVPLTEVFDDFNVVSTNQFTAPTAGTYLFTISGNAYAGADVPLKLKVTSGTVSYFVIKKQQMYPVATLINYIDSNIFKLNAGDTVELVLTSATLGNQVDGILFGYKL